MVDQAQQLGVELDSAKAKLYEMQSASVGTFSSGEIKDQQIHVNGLQAEWNSVQGRVERYDANINNATIELDRNKEKAGEVAQQINKAGDNSNRMSGAVDSAGESMGRFASRIKEVVRSALVFVVITQALAKLRDWIGTVVKSSPEATAAIAKLKAALLVLAQPLVNVIIPAFTRFVTLLAGVITKIAELVAALFGTTFDKSKASAAALNAQTSAIKDVGKAAKEATKSLAPFDEIQQLTTSDTSGSGAGGSGSSGIAPDFSGLDEFSTTKYKKKVNEITTIISGALLALGTILVFSGANVPLGLGLMAVGALGLAAEVKENWENVPDHTRKVIAEIFAVVGTALLAFGAILALASPKTLPLGIGLMAAGAAALVASVLINWDHTVDSVKDVVKKILYILGGALIVIGAVLAFASPKTLPLGIGLMAAGALSLAAAAAVSWTSTTDNISKVISKILLIVGGAALVLGIILVCTGWAIPLGIALIALGAASLVTTAAINKNTIISWLTGAWNGVKSWFDNNVAPKFTVSYWKNKFDTIKQALVQKVKDAVNGGIYLFNRFISWINSKMKFSWGAIKILGKTVVSAGSVQLINIPQIPYLATGAVIPPNQQFLAMLGDQKSGNNIEAPESLIRRIVREESGNGDMTFNITAELDGEVIYRNQRKVARRFGAALA